MDNWNILPLESSNLEETLDNNQPLPELSTHQHNNNYHSNDTHYNNNNNNNNFSYQQIYNILDNNNAIFVHPKFLNFLRECQIQEDDLGCPLHHLETETDIETGDHPLAIDSTIIMETMATTTNPEITNPIDQHTLGLLTQEKTRKPFKTEEMRRETRRTMK